MEITRISRHQATASSNAAAPIVITPTSVSTRLRSVRIRAKTGKAVMDMLKPVNKRKDAKGAS
jgi:hypothetical protein